MMGFRKPRKMKNRGMRAAKRKSLNPMSASDKIGRLKAAIKKIEEHEAKNK